MNVLAKVEQLTHSKALSFSLLLLITAAIPLTVIVAQQQQNLQQNAAGKEAIVEPTPEVTITPTPSVFPTK